MATQQTIEINTTIQGIPFIVNHIYSNKKEFNGRSHWLTAQLGKQHFQDKIYYKLSETQARKYAELMLTKAKASVEAKLNKVKTHV
jgi:hypothetical protein